MVAADRIGICDFRATGTLMGVGGNPNSAHSIRYAEVLLRVQQADEICQWLAIVGFTDAPMMVDGILGISGGLEFFHTTLDVFANQITMIPRHTLPVAETA